MRKTKIKDFLEIFKYFSNRCEIFDFNSKKFQNFERLLIFIISIN